MLDYYFIVLISYVNVLVSYVIVLVCYVTVLDSYVIVLVSYVTVLVRYVTVLVMLLYYTLSIGQSVTNLALRQSGTFPPVQSRVGTVSSYHSF